MLSKHASANLFSDNSKFVPDHIDDVILDLVEIQLFLRPLIFAFILHPDLVHIDKHVH